MEHYYYLDKTTFLAQLIGLFFMTAGLAMTLRRKMMMSIFRDFFRTRALSYLLGVLLLLTGLLIMLQHNLWQGLTQILISGLGWYLFIESVVYLFRSEGRMKKALEWLENKKLYYFISFAYLLLGGYLVYAGFIAR